MMEEGTLSIVRRGQTYQVRYAANNPSTRDDERSTHPDEAHMCAWLHHCGVDPWAIQQAAAELRHGRMAVLPIVWTPAQRHASFPVPAASGTPPGRVSSGTHNGEDAAQGGSRPQRGILRTIRLGSTYQTLYLSHHSPGTACEPYLSPDEASLRAFLHTVGLAEGEIEQHCVGLQHQYTHTLVRVLSEAHVHACFPTVRRPPAVVRESRSATDGQGHRR
jgi:hypothetical protein